MIEIVAAMIVRNEAPVLRRCFDSLRKAGISKIIVNDNGSTDDTPKILEEYGVIQVPGPWVDFATNRNLVLGVARRWGDYVLCGIDADEELITPDGWGWPALNADLYSIYVRNGNLLYPRHALINSLTGASWQYVIHEILMLEDPNANVPAVPGPHILVHKDGHRATDPHVQQRDLNVLLKACMDYPEEPRYVFYTAQTFKDLNFLESAAHYYRKRIDMGGYYQERWYSQYMLGRIEDWCDRNPISEYLKAYDMNVGRVEPLYHAADWLRRNHQPRAAYALVSGFRKHMLPGLFVESDVYEWRLLDLIASCAWWADEKAAGAAASQALSMRQFPEEHRVRIEANAKLYENLWPK
jgi:glycosyltransferase involved in cell wall biosynthesis